MLVHGLIDSIVDHMHPVLDSFSKRLETLEEVVLEDHPDVLYTKEAHVLQVGARCALPPGRRSAGASRAALVVRLHVVCGVWYGVGWGGVL
jgi:Mg2+ and Co2+ transporter CorA